MTAADAVDAHLDAEIQCREFAAEFPTPNVRRAIALAECGRVSWQDVYGVFHAAAVAATRTPLATDTATIGA